LIVGDAGTVLFTRDAGASWVKQNVGVSTTLYHVDFRDDRNGWALANVEHCCARPTAARRGRSIPTNVNVTLLSIQFLNDDEGWAIGRSGTILRSSDEGKTWVRQESTTKQNLYSLNFNKKIGWVVGGAGWRCVTSASSVQATCEVLKDI
jgi:photosystem II stability/assembly factor-like uncharacterized protein